jgi:hypothetical protein
LKTLDQLTVKAPKSGMVIYSREWDGKKRIVGSTVSSWEPTVANLPDLRTMESVTYVNEVDIQKIKKGQKVSIGLDAQPEKKLQGVVKTVASIGEQKPNSEAKVFEVVIDILTNDTSLRPAMTTSNNISVNTMPDVLSLPLEAVHGSGGNSFVYKKEGVRLVKKQIKTGTVSETHAVVTAGLDENDVVLLSIPKDTTDIHYVSLNP